MLSILQLSLSDYKMKAAYCMTEKHKKETDITFNSTNATLVPLETHFCSFFLVYKHKYFMTNVT